MRQRGWFFSVLWLVVCGVLVADFQAFAQGQRDITPMPKVQAGSVPITGHYWAVIIGIDEYQGSVANVVENDEAAGYERG